MTTPLEPAAPTDVTGAPFSDEGTTAGPPATTVPDRMPAPVPHPAAAPGDGPVGQVRGTGTVILLGLVTLGVYGLVYYYCVHAEMKRHTGQGVGGGLGLVIALFIGVVTVFLVPSEVGGLYQRRGQTPPVSAVTGLWCLLPIVGPFIWLFRTNGALNDYWRSLGAR